MLLLLTHISLLLYIPLAFLLVNRFNCFYFSLHFYRFYSLTLSPQDASACTASAGGDPYGMQWCPAESDTTLMSQDNWFWYEIFFFLLGFFLLFVLFPYVSKKNDAGIHTPPPLRNLTELLIVYLQTVGRRCCSTLSTLSTFPSFFKVSTPSSLAPTCSWTLLQTPPAFFLKVSRIFFFFFLFLLLHSHIPTDAFVQYDLFGESISLFFHNNTIASTSGHVTVGGDLYLNLTQETTINLIELREDIARFIFPDLKVSAILPSTSCHLQGSAGGFL